MLSPSYLAGLFALLAAVGSGELEQGKQAVSPSDDRAQDEWWRRQEEAFRTDPLTILREFLARRPKPPEGEGILLDVRQMPLTAQLEREGGKLEKQTKGHAPSWWFTHPSGEIEVSLALLEADFDPRQVPNWGPDTTLALGYRPGPPGLGEVSIEIAGGNLRLCWINRNVSASISVSRPWHAGTRRANPPPDLHALAASLDRWLDGQVVHDLPTHRPRLVGLSVYPGAVHVGDHVRVSWQISSATPDAIEASARADRLSHGEANKTHALFKAGSTGRAAITVEVLDSRSLLMTTGSLEVEVYDFKTKYGHLATAELAKLFDPQQPELNWSITERLLVHPADYVAELVAEYAREERHGSRQRDIVMALWREPCSHRQLLENVVFQQDLSYWVQDLPSPVAELQERIGIARVKAVVRQVLAELVELGRSDVAATMVQSLPGDVIIDTWKSIRPVFHSRQDYIGAIALLERANSNVRRNSPEYILYQSNVAIEQMMLRDYAGAAERLDRLLRRDWRVPEKLWKTPLGELQARASTDAVAGRTFGVRTYLALAYYNRACLWALTQRPEQAVAALKRARELAADNYPAAKLLAEADFSPLRDYPPFLELVNH